MSALLRSTTGENRALWSVRLAENLLGLKDMLPGGKAIAVFGGIKSEPDLRPLIGSLWEQDVPVVLFSMDGPLMHPYLVREESDILSGQMGVWEPSTDENNLIQASELGIVLVPGLVFARRDGARLGRGAGFYDRFLSRPEVSVRRIGVGFATQMIETMPSEPHDMHMQALVSEDGWWDVAAQQSATSPSFLI